MTVSGKSSDIIAGYLDLLRRPLQRREVAVRPLTPQVTPRDVTRSCALIFSPHPDDECLVGALPLRLLQEAQWQIVNVAVTLGSNQERKSARSTELARACAILGFQCILSHEDGFSDITCAASEAKKSQWHDQCRRIADIVEHYNPTAIFMPHLLDAHPVHSGTHALVSQALSLLPAEFSTTLFETEYWQTMADPNVMIGLGQSDTALLLEALICHAGENARNPFDARFPAFLIDNVRRGSERIGGVGARSLVGDFAMLYRKSLWCRGKGVVSALKHMIGEHSPVGESVL